jgi:hypothetical protein
MKKQPNTDRISNALAESSLFFNPPAPLDTSTPRIQDTQTPRRPDAQDSRTLDTETSRTPDALTRGFDVTEKADERQTLRLSRVSAVGDGDGHAGGGA